MGCQMRDGFVKNHLPPNRYTGSDEVFQLLVDFVSRFTQLKAGMPQAFFSFIPHALLKLIKEKQMYQNIILAYDGSLESQQALLSFKEISQWGRQDSLTLRLIIHLSQRNDL
jgi:hypothetical protein